MKRIRCYFNSHKFDYKSAESCEKVCKFCGERHPSPFVEHKWGPWSEFDGYVPQVRKCQRCKKVDYGGPAWTSAPKDPRGRLIVGKLPNFKPLEPSNGLGESSWRSIKDERISVINETDRYRKIFIKMTVANGFGVTNYDPSGCWGGAGEGLPYEVEYTAIETKDFHSP